VFCARNISATVSDMVTCKTEHKTLAQHFCKCFILNDISYTSLCNALHRCCIFYYRLYTLDGLCKLFRVNKVSFLTNGVKSNFFLSRFYQRGPAYLNSHQIQQRRIWTSPAPFLYNQCSCCHEDTDPVWETRLLRLRSKYLEPHIPPHIRNLHSAPAFRKALKTFVLGNRLDSVMHYRSHCCR